MDPIRSRRRTSGQFLTVSQKGRGPLPASLDGAGETRWQRPPSLLANGKKLTGRPPSRAYRVHSKATDISTFLSLTSPGRLRMFLRRRQEASGIPLAVL